MGVLYLSTPNDAFETVYLNARRKEHRVFTNSEVALLPEVAKSHPLYKEWQLRKKSAARFIKYLKNQKRPLKILDIGCGNGWFSNLMSDVPNVEVTALDVNDHELNQADAVFQKPNLKFLYADIFESQELRAQQFDVIVFNSCFQYFENAAAILDRAMELLGNDGEIHIIDTPFYRLDQLSEARQRTQSYYEKLGFPEMA
ncbi:MAG: class I SAM-dependent methyltransferase, partial [Flavobacterium sp.]